MAEEKLHCVAMGPFRSGPSKAIGDVLDGQDAALLTLRRKELMAIIISHEEGERLLHFMTDKDPGFSADEYTAREMAARSSGVALKLWAGDCSLVWITSHGKEAGVLVTRKLLDELLEACPELVGYDWRELREYNAFFDSIPQ